MLAKHVFWNVLLQNPFMAKQGTYGFQPLFASPETFAYKQPHPAGLLQTIGVSFVLKKAFGMHLALWDTAGQERYAALSRLYARKNISLTLESELVGFESGGSVCVWRRWIAPAKD